MTMGEMPTLAVSHDLRSRINLRISFLSSIAIIVYPSSPLSHRPRRGIPFLTFSSYKRINSRLPWTMARSVSMRATISRLTSSDDMVISQVASLNCVKLSPTSFLAKIKSIQFFFLCFPVWHDAREQIVKLRFVVQIFQMTQFMNDDIVNNALPILG